MIDLHTHSLYSDGDLAAVDLLELAGQRGVTRLALTDHNTLAAAAQIDCIAGVEISTLWAGSAVHILGYGRQWNVSALQAGLASTRAGYYQRVKQMIELCHQAGYHEVSLGDIEEARSGQTEPAFTSYDVVKELMVKHNLPLDAARALTLEGGAAYVPYSDWAMTPQQAIELVHRCAGLAVLAHPGITGHEQGVDIMWRLINELTQAKLDGLEAYHHFHDQPLQQELLAYCQKNNLLVTGGSDFHIPNDRDFLGQVGLSKTDWQKFEARLSST